MEGLKDFRRPEVVDVLLVALADPESLVRLTAHASLKAITGQRFDFDDASQSSRSSSQRRWSEWWDKNRAAQRFYEKLGMNNIGTTDFTDGKSNFVNFVYATDL